MTPYAGMNEKTKWRLHTMRLVMNFIRRKTLRSALWHCPILHAVARRVLEIVTKVTNLETVKIEFRHLRFLLSSARLTPLREQCRDQNTHEQS